MSDREPIPDYNAMSGGAFKHAVGHDPAKWAEAMLQSEQREAWSRREDRLRWLIGWLSDLAEAVRTDERRYRITPRQGEHT